MKLLYQTTVLLFLITFFSGISAQNSFRAGKIITNNGDTLTGFIDARTESKLFKECLFKQQENSPVLTYKPADIRAYLLVNDMRKFIRGSLHHASGNVFLEVLCEGNLNLYYLNNDATNYFIQKKGEKAVHTLPYERTERYVDNGYTKRLKVIETTYHIDTLKMVMKDRLSLYSDIEKIHRPERQNLMEIVSKYNSNNPVSQTQKSPETTVEPNKPVLLRTGKMNLYVQTNASDEKQFYIRKESGSRLIELPFTKKKDINYRGILIHSYANYTTNHIDTLKKYMADAIPLYPSIDEIRIPTKKKLQKLTDEYNAYTDENTYVQKHTLKRLPLNIDVVPGFNYAFANLQNHVVKFGSFLDIGFLQSNKYIYFRSGLFVYKGYTPLTDNYYSSGYLSTYYPPATTWLIPLQVEFRFSEKMIQPTLSVGYNFYLFDEIKPFNKSLLPVISPGINIQMNKRFSVHMNLEFEFKDDKLMAYIPKTFKKAGLFFGLQIKL